MGGPPGPMGGPPGPMGAPRMPMMPPRMPGKFYAILIYMKTKDIEEKMPLLTKNVYFNLMF